MTIGHREFDFGRKHCDSNEHWRHWRNWVPRFDSSSLMIGDGRMAVFAAVFLLAVLVSAAGAQEGEEGTLKWSFETKGWMRAPAIGADGTIYVGSGDKNLYALTPEGKLKWAYKTGGWIVASAAIGSDGTIYVGSQDGKLYALTPDGKRKWAFNAGDMFSTPALGTDGTIYVGNHDSYLYAITPEGKRKWSVKIESSVSAASSSPAIGADGTVYFGGRDNRLHAFTPDGNRKWAVQTAGGDGVTSPAIGVDGTIYVANGASEFGQVPAGAMFTLYAISPAGEIKWKFETKKSAPFPSYSPVVGPDGTIYYPAHRLHAISPDGKEKWTYATGNFTFSPPAIGADGNIYLNTMTALYALTPFGTLKWKANTPGQGNAFPAIGTDGTVYVSTDAGAVDSRWGESTNHLLAFRTSSRGHAAGPWPTYQARWMKHGSAQTRDPAHTLDSAATPWPPAPADANPQQLEAYHALRQRGIPFASERFLECAAVGDGTCVKLFIAAGMNPDVQDEPGSTALMRALGSGHMDVANILLEKGANPDAQYKDGGTALMSAAQFGRLNVVEMLLAKGANPNVQDKAGHTALRRASYQGHLKVVSALLEKGADPNLQDKRGGTALMGAAQWGYVEVVKMLLAKGADIGARDDDGKTALTLAKAHTRGPNRDAVIDLLVEAAATKK